MTCSIPACLLLITCLATSNHLAAQTASRQEGGDAAWSESADATPRIMISDIHFGQAPVTGTPKSHHFRIRNTSTDGGVLIVTGVASGPRYPAIFQTPDGYPVFPLTLEAGEESAQIRVTFDPAAPISYQDEILFTHNAGANPANDSVAHMRGEGIYSILAATSMVWNRERVGTGPYTGTVTLTNVGNQALHIDDATASGNVNDFGFDFARFQNLTLDGGTSITVDVTFSPKAIGPRQMTITYNQAAGEPVVTSTLTGVGVEPTLGTFDHHFGNHATGASEVEMRAKFFMVANANPPYVDSVTIVALHLVNDAEGSFRYEMMPGYTLPYVLSGTDDTLDVRVYFTPKSPGGTSASLTAITEDINAAGLLVQATSNWNAESTGSSSAREAKSVAGLSLGPIAPAPSDGWTTVSYTVPAASSVAITLVDIAGRTVGTMLQKNMIAAGSHTLRFDLSELPAGSYFCRMVVGESVLVHPLVVR